MKKSLLLLVALLFVALSGWGQCTPTQFTDFTSFSTGTVNYQGPGCTTVTGLGYTIPDPYGSLWTVADEWGFTCPFDEGVKDDGTGNMVWRISNAITSGSYSCQPNSPSSLLPAGETTAALYNDRGPDHTNPYSPAHPRATAGSKYFHGGFKFKSATGAAQTGLFISINPIPRQTSYRMTYVGIQDVGTGFNLVFYETTPGGVFPSTTIASNLSYTDWHQVDIYIEFKDGLNIDGSGNDIVTVKLDGTTIKTGTTWESYYAENPSSFPSPIAVDVLMFRSAGTAAPGTSGNGLYFDDVTYDNSPVPPVHNTTQNTFYATIQAAINAANPAGGDVIEVAAGTYHERLNINKPLDLRGAQYGIDPTLTGARTNPLAESIIDVVGLSVPNPDVLIEIPTGTTNVLISGFTLNGGQSTPHNADQSAIRCWDDHITIQNNIIDGYSSVLYKGNDYINILHNRITDNSTAIVVQPNAATNVVIHGNSILPGSSPVAAAQGIYMTGVTTGSVSNNTVSGFSGSNGCGGSNINYVTIDGNILTGNLKGINIWGNTTNMNIQNNTITNSVGRGIDIKGAQLTITNNIIQNNGAEGVRIAYHVIPTVNVTINNNAISGNIGNNLLVDVAVTQMVDGTCNWWGTTDPVQIQAKVSGIVKLSPFLVTNNLLTPNCSGNFPAVNQQTGLGYLTIQDAVNAATNGQTILVNNAGTYGGIVFNTGITLTLTNNSGGVVTIVGASPALTVASGDVTVTGFNYTTATDDPTVLVSGGKLTMTNCTITESTGFTQSAISVTGGELAATHNTIVPGDGKGLTQTAGIANATGNYWGTTVASEVAALMTGTVNYTPWCNSNFTVCNLGIQIVTNIGAPASTACGVYDFPVTVQQFANVGSISLILNYSASVFTYAGVTVNPAISADAITNGLTAGKFKLGYYGNPVTLGLDEVLFTLHLTLLPAISGTLTNLTWSTASGDCEYAGDNGDIIFASQFNSFNGWAIPVRPVENTNTHLEYCTIQAAISAPQTLNGHTIAVSAGLYKESNITVNKQLTIQGIGATNADVVIAPSIADSKTNSSFGGTYSYGFLLGSGSITIKDLTIDGNANTGLADHSFRAGVMTDFRIGAMFNNITVQNVNIQHTYRRGIQIYSGMSSGSTGHVITGNTLNDVVIGPAITVLDGDATITGNTIGNVPNGSGIEGSQSMTSGMVSIIKGNTISNVYTGIQTVSSASGTIIGGPNPADRNTINLTGADYDIGIILRNAQGGVTVQNNLVNGSENDAGIWLYADGTVSNPVLISGNVLNATNSGSLYWGSATGIFITNDGIDYFSNGSDQPTYATISGNQISGFETGVSLVAYGYTPSLAIVNATISGNTISGGTTGIYVYDYNGATGGYAATATIQNNTSTITGAVIGVDIDGGSATLLQNNITANGTGVSIENGGTLLSASQNFITNNTTAGIKIESSAGAIGAISNNNLSGNPTGNAINSQLGSLISAECNWYGMTDNAGVSAKITGNVDYTPWLVSGVDFGGIPADGFQPVPNSCMGEPIVFTCGSNVTIPYCPDQSAVNAAYAAFIASTTATGCDGVLTNNAPVAAPSICGGFVDVTWTYTSSCEVLTCTRTFTVTPSPAVVFNCAVDNTEAACQTQSAINNSFTAWLSTTTASGGCNGILTNNSTNAPLACGGYVDVTWTYTSTCAPLTTSCTKRFTVTDAPAVIASAPANYSKSACEVLTQAQINADFATFLAGFTVSDGCAPHGSIVGTPTAPVLCDGGTTTVTYNWSDQCSSGQKVATFTITKPTAVIATAPNNYTKTSCVAFTQGTVDADFATFLSQFTVTNGCDPQGSFVGTPTAPVLCTGGTVTVTYNWSDLCESGQKVSTFTITPPSAVVATKPTNFATTACTYANQTALDAAFTSWLTGFGVSSGCTPAGSYGSPTAPLIGVGGTTTVTYNWNDLCQSGQEVATFTIYPTQTLSGTFTYYNIANTAMSNTTVELWQGLTLKYTAVTTLGNYTVSNVCPGNYDIHISTTSTAGGVNATDASQVNYWGTVPYQIEKVRFYAGDVTGSTFWINGLDAQAILFNFVNGALFSKPDPYWAFWKAGETISSNTNPAESYPSVTMGALSGVVANIYGMSRGDFNRSYTPDGAKAASNTLDLFNEGTMYAGPGQTIDLPLHILNASSVGAVSLILNFPTDLVEVQDVQMNGTNGNFAWTVNGNELRIGWNSLQPISLAAAETLLTLKLKTTSAFTGSAKIEFTLAADPLNELADGAYEVIPDAVLTSNVIVASATGIEESIAPEELTMSNHPNPFNGSTTITYTLPFDGTVTLDIYNYVGSHVRSMVSEAQLAGAHSVKLDDASLAAGMYMARLTVKNANNKFVRTIKLVNNK